MALLCCKRMSVKDDTALFWEIISKYNGNF